MLLNGLICGAGVVTDGTGVAGKIWYMFGLYMTQHIVLIPRVVPALVTTPAVTILVLRHKRIDLAVPV